MCRVTQSSCLHLGIRVFVFVYLYICMFSVYWCVSVFSFATRVWWNKMNINVGTIESLHATSYYITKWRPLSHCLPFIAQYWSLLTRGCLSLMHLFSVTSVNIAVNPILLKTARCLKKVPIFKLSVTLSNLNRFSKFLHCRKAYEICYKTVRHYHLA